MITSSDNSKYTFFVTDDQDLLKVEPTNGPIIFDDLDDGDYRVYGLSLTNEMNYIYFEYLEYLDFSDDCYRISENYISVSVGSESEYCNTSSTKEEVLSEMIKLYPNPGKDFLTIATDPSIDVINYHIYDKVGKLIQKGTKNDRIDLSSLPQGIYLIKISTNDGEWNEKIVKQ